MSLTAAPDFFCDDGILFCLGCALDERDQLRSHADGRLSE
jgi:hypothetical protein